MLCKYIGFKITFFVKIRKFTWQKPLAAVAQLVIFKGSDDPELHVTALTYWIGNAFFNWKKKQKCTLINTKFVK